MSGSRPPQENNIGDKKRVSVVPIFCIVLLSLGAIFSSLFKEMLDVIPLYISFPIVFLLSVFITYVIRHASKN